MFLFQSSDKKPRNRSVLTPPVANSVQHNPYNQVFFDFMSRDICGTNVFNKLLHMGCISWVFSPSVVNFQVFPEFCFISKHEWDTFSPFSEQRRAKRAGEAIEFVKKINRNLNLKISQENIENMHINRTNSHLANQPTFRGFRDTVLAFFQDFNDDFIFSPFFHRLAITVTQGLFSSWCYNSVEIEQYDQYFGWKWFANVIYTFNVVLTHHNFVLEHIETKWGPKIHAHDKMMIQRFLKSFSTRHVPA